MVELSFKILLEFENKIKVLEITYKEEKFMLKEKFEQDQSQISYIKDLMEFVRWPIA